MWVSLTNAAVKIRWDMACFFVFVRALFEPKTLPAKVADFLDDDDQVLGVSHNGIARAYPTRILSRHELVNDDFGGDPLLVSW